ncbi:MAG: GyrI-like domain-containing protein [Candidatus Thorarchaeota archaeon]
MRLKKISLEELGISPKKLEETLIATIRCSIKSRQEIQAIIDKLSQTIPEDKILGPAFCITHYTSDVKDGFDVEIGFPVSQSIDIGEIKTRTLPKRDVLSFIHKGSVEERREKYGTVFGFTNSHGIISDEFSREIYLDSNNPEGNEFELQFIIHDWNRLLAKNVERVLGKQAREEIMQGSNDITLESSLDERVDWIKGAIRRIEDLTNEIQRYDIISGCAHFFPTTLIDKLRTVYQENLAQTQDPLAAVDAVREFMGKSPGWPDEVPPRNGNIIISTKRPANPEGYAKATTDAERRRAYCFCPVVRDSLEKGIPEAFCNCSSGWFRQQWEGALGKPIPKIDILKSIVKGDDVCQFAIHLPEDL